MSTLVLREAEVDGARVDVRVEGAQITAVGPPRSATGAGAGAGADVEIDCGGAALLPGLHDHHLHLFAMAAAMDSVDVAHDLDAVVRAAHAAAPPDVGIRAVNYDEGHEGPLDRWRLDALAPGRAVRVQHRSGALWVLSTTALEEAEAFSAMEAGLERDHRGRPTGRLFRLDDWLGQRTPRTGAPNLAAVGRRLASFGVTGVTDCTPTVTTDYFEAIAAAVRSGELPLGVSTTGGVELSDVVPPAPLRRGPVKVVIADHALPALDELIEQFGRAHEAGRAVAVHCVTRSALLLALAAWQEVGSRPGDRVEHASVVPPEVIATLAGLSLTVVTQPAFVAARGDVYLSEVDPIDRPDLYRCGSLIDGGVVVGGSTDAPFGPDDPWVAVRAAVERRAASGAPVGSDRGLEPGAAVRLFLGTPEQPGGPIRRIGPGRAADLCLLDVPLRTALLDASSRHVALTIAAGNCTFTA
jgi:predicted amidohydrolase YtcJ